MELKVFSLNKLLENIKILKRTELKTKKPYKNIKELALKDKINGES
jgi:hypothetical protein